MPGAIRTKCSYPTCPDVAERRGRCRKHATANDRGARESSTGRGYDWTWRRFRARLLRMSCRRCEGNPVATCRLCGGSGLEFAFCRDCIIQQNKMEPTQEIHHPHKLRDGGPRLDRDNCMGLCKRHHQARTAAGE